MRRMVALLMVVAALTGCSQPSMALPIASSPVAANVDGQAISMSAYGARLAVSRARDPYAGVPEDIPSPVPTQRLETFTIEQLIREAIVREESSRRGISISDQQVSLRMTQLREKNPEGFDAALQRNGFTPGSFRDYERSLMTEVALLHGMAKERITQAGKELKAGQDFNAVVGRWNDDQGTSSRNGEVGWLRPDDLPEPPLRAAVRQLSVGSTSDVVETNRGFVIAHLLDQRGDQLRLALLLVLAPSIDLFSPQGIPAWFTKFLDDRESALRAAGKLTVNVGSHA